MFNLNCQRSEQIRTGRLLSDIPARDTNASDRCPRNLSNIPRDFPRCQPVTVPITGSAGAPSALERRAKRATCRSSRPFHLYQRTKAPERSISVKNFCWRFCDSANLPENSVPDFQPRGRGSYYEASCLRCRLLLRDSNHSRIRRRQSSLLLTFL